MFISVFISGTVGLRKPAVPTLTVVSELAEIIFLPEQHSWNTLVNRGKGGKISFSRNKKNHPLYQRFCLIFQNNDNTIFCRLPIEVKRGWGPKWGRELKDMFANRQNDRQTLTESLG